MSKKLHKGSKGVAHHTLERTRLKIPKHYKNKRHLREIQERLLEVPGIHNVEVNDTTGSVVVHHRHDIPIFEVLGKTIGTICSELLTLLVEEQEAKLAGFSLAVAGAGLVGEMAKNLFSQAEHNGHAPASLSGSLQDLRNLVPAGLLAAAIYKTVETRTFWSGVAPAVLAYWAFDSYWKFNCSAPTPLNVSESEPVRRKPKQADGPNLS